MAGKRRSEKNYNEHDTAYKSEETEKRTERIENLRAYVSPKGYLQRTVMFISCHS